GIRINIITHSLGARVALSALNVLGDFDDGYNDKVDNLIMWEAAVADNALTNLDNYEAKKAYNPVAMEIFPYAWKVPKHISVLYSQEDGVLDGDRSRRDDEVLGLLGGAYPKKYWAIGQSKWAFYDYYKGTKIEQYRSIIHAGRFNTTSYTLKGIQPLPPMSLTQYRKSIRELLEREAEQVNEHGAIAELNYLKPWSHFRRFPIGGEVLEHIIEVLTDNVLSNWSGEGSDVRGALGHCGNRRTTEGLDKWGEKVSAKEAKRWHDKFIASLPIEKLEFFGQWEDREEGRFYYFISHSAMREWEYPQIDVHDVFRLIYKYSYREWIMRRKIQKHSKFGRY
ncbi:hypothetical protein HYE54_07220, partial [Aggregatibacter actinomycetemcomitans]|nr:hypothetical protein [Aggregatibacter actinomycetemcomitans]MBN6086478.1 hypothetical protein [Aggregatibacter actinomycetemcomitans]